MRLLFSLFVSFAGLFGFDAYNGKTFILLFSPPTGYISLGERNITMLPHPSSRDHGIALLPIDYHTPAQELVIQLRGDFGEVAIPVTIHPFNYPSETLSVDSSKVTPPPEALEQIAQEKAEAEKIYNTITPIRYWNQPFIYPMDTVITSEYGSARTYNDVLKSYHGGVDFRARTPLPILSTNDGVVVLVKDRYYAGGTVIIDHGEGIYSCYFHMSQFNVSVGDRVTRGQNIGLTGATGRITGPHLHFGMMIYGIQTDPLNFIDQINTLFPKESNETFALH